MGVTRDEYEFNRKLFGSMVSAAVEGKRFKSMADVARSLGISRTHLYDLMSPHCTYQPSGPLTQRINEMFPGLLFWSKVSSKSDTNAVQDAPEVA